MGFLHSPNSDGIEAGMYEVTGERCNATAKSILISADGKSVWLPYSKIKFEVNPDETITVLMPPWLAKMKGFL